jgi:hypothetical protein
MTPFVQKHFDCIKEFYGDRKAERSQVPYINHISEGLIILDAIEATDEAKGAYCLHPIFQSDDDLIEYLEDTNSATTLLEAFDIPTKTIVLAMEYRRVANSYLSKDHPSKYVNCPINDVFSMLIADKVQNRKDFELHHKGTHPRSFELTGYFEQWMAFLLLGEAGYKRLSSLIK